MVNIDDDTYPYPCPWCGKDMFYSHLGYRADVGFITAYSCRTCEAKEGWKFSYFHPITGEPMSLKHLPEYD